MKTVNSTNTSNNVLKYQGIYKKLQPKIKVENYYTNNTDNMIILNDVLPNNFSNKNIRTLSMDLSNTTLTKKSINENDIGNNMKENFEISISNSNNSTIINQKKNIRTNSITLHNSVDYRPNTDNVPFSTHANNFTGAGNTGLDICMLNKKQLTKTNSGNSTTLSRYISNLSKSKKNNKNASKTINTNTTMSSVYNCQLEQQNKSHSKSTMNDLTLAYSTTNKRKDILLKTKVLFPKNTSIKISTPNESVINTCSNFPIKKEPRSINSLNISREISNKSPLSLVKTPEDDENEPPLTNETKIKLTEIKQSIIELLNNNRNKNLVLKELDNIYKYVMKSNTPSTCDEEALSYNAKKSIFSSSSSASCSLNLNMKSSKRNEREVNLNEFENQLLKKENETLKNKIEVIDKKFDKISTENLELREYVKEKSDNIDELRNILNTFKKELNEVKQQNNNKHFGNESNPDTSVNISIDDRNMSIEQMEFRNSNNVKTPCLNIKGLNNDRRSEEVKLDDYDVISEKEKTACFAEPTCHRSYMSKILCKLIDKKNINKESNNNQEIFNLDSFKQNNVLIDELKFKPKIKLNISKNNNKSKSENQSKSIDFSQKQILNSFNLGLNLKNIKKHSDFNQEFMENYSDFSPSWRKEVEKINLSIFFI